MTKDLTKGKTLGIIFNFTLPILFGILFQQVYNLVDTVIVGKGIGIEALAAVGSTGSVFFLILGFCIGTTAGLSIPVAQSFGAGDYRKMRRYIFNSALVTIVIALVFTTLTVIYCEPLLILMLTPADILDQAVSYVRIVFMGIPFLLLFNLVSSVLRAVGDTKTPLTFLIVSSILNIFLDLLLILVFRLGVAGAAIATVTSQGAAGIICLFYLKRKFPAILPEKEERKIDLPLIADLLRSGVPMGLQYSVTAVGSVLLQVSVNTLGTGIVAAMAAGVKINVFFCAPFDALGTTMSTFTGQNVGARRWKRLKKGMRDSMIIGSVYSLAAFVFLAFFGKTLGLLFVDSGETAILQNIHSFLFFNSMFFIPLTAVNVVRFMIQGMGFGSIAIFSGLFEMIARTVFAFFIVPKWGYSAVCFSSPTAWILADLFLFPAFFFCLKLLITRDRKKRVSLEPLYSA